MINIRNNVFETKSSSSHNLVVFKGNYEVPDHIDPEWYVDNNGILKIYFQNDLEFGRAPFELLTNWYRRLCFAIASCPDRIKEIEEACFRHLDGVYEIQYPTDIWGNGGSYYGYIDHQSTGLLSKVMALENITFDDFIFNDKYMVVIDGDEYCIFDTLQQTPAWNQDNVEVIYD